MKPAAAVVLTALIVALPGSVRAGSGLRDTMDSWKADARSIRDGLNSQTSYDETAIRADFQGYVSDAGQISARINPRTAEARDFKARFAAFQGDAQAALRDVGKRPSLARDYARLMDDCQSCHNIYKD